MSVNPLLLDFPDHFETERLILRSPRLGDGPAVYAALQESLPELLPWMPWAHTETHPEDSESFVRRNAAWFMMRQELTFSMFRREDAYFIGNTGIHSIDWDLLHFEIGYWIRTSEQRKGYVSEAVRGLTRFCFETLQAERVEIRCDSDNERSAAGGLSPGGASAAPPPEGRWQQNDRYAHFCDAARGISGGAKSDLINDAEKYCEEPYFGPSPAKFQ